MAFALNKTLSHDFTPLPHHHHHEKAPEKEVERAPLAEGEEDHDIAKPHSKIFNLRNFVINVCLMTICIAIATNERFAQLTTLEKRFGFTSGELGIVISSYDAGHVIVLIIMSVIGHKVHQPRTIGVGAVFGVISCLLWLTPHIIFGGGDSMSTSTTISITNFTNASRTDPTEGLCIISHNPNRTTGCENYELSGNTTSTGRDETQVWVSFSFFLLSQAFMGAALAPILTIALTYVDDNTDPQNSAACVGIIFSVFGLGAVAGFLLAAWTLTNPIDLKPTHFSMKDPEWLGAWWLGSAITAVVLFIVCIPIFFFPRSLTKETDKKSQKEEKIKKQSEDERLKNTSTNQTSEGSAKKPKSLARNVVFICCTLAMITVSYLPGALFVFMPKYYEMQFMMTPTLSNIIVSGVTAGAMTVGTFAGGYISAALSLERKGNALLTVIVCTIGLGCLFATLFLGCPTASVSGNIDSSGFLNASNTCNWNCTCAGDFNPVCGSDQMMYYSACHAGCRDLQSDIDGNMVYGNCSCLTGEDASGWGKAESGWCPSGCKMYIPYSILIFFANFCVCMASSPFMAILLRSVDPRQKSLSLGLNNIFTSIFGTIPGPIIYGKLIDLACQLYSPSCEGGSGNCILLDNYRLRIYIHGATIAAVVIAALSMFVALIDVLITERGQETSSSKPELEQKEQIPMIELNSQ